MSNTYKIIKVNRKSKREHRHLMEKFLGRKLDFNETIHHKNGNKRDNRIKNLEIVSRSDHSKKYNKRAEMIEFKCQVCGEKKKIRKKFYAWRKKKGQKYFYCSRKCFSGDLKKRIYPKFRKDIDKLILEELKKGNSGYKIAKKYNFNRATVYNHINKYI